MTNIIEEIVGWGAMDWLKALIIIGIVMSLGLFSVNQYLAYRYKAEFLTTPCDLCKTLNPAVEECFHTIIDNSNIPQVNLTEETKRALVNLNKAIV